MFAHTHVMIDFPLNLKPSNHPKTTVHEFRWAKKSHVFNVMPMQMFQLPAIIIQSNLRPMSDKCGTNWIFKMTTEILIPIGNQNYTNFNSQNGQ